MTFSGIPAFSTRVRKILVVFAGIVELGELLADGAQLLAEDVLALRVVDRLLDVLVDLGTQLRHLDLAREQRDERSQPRDVIGFLKQRHAVVEVEIGTGARDVGDQFRITGTRHGDRRVGADLRAGIDVVGEERSHRPEERVHLGAFSDIRDGHRRDGRGPGIAGGVERIDAHAFLALDERVRAPTGQPPESADVGDDRDGVDVVERRLVAGGVALDREHHSSVAVHRGLERRDRARAARRPAAPAARGTRRCPGAAPPGASATPAPRPRGPARRARKAQRQAWIEHSRGSAPSNVECHAPCPSPAARPRRSTRRLPGARCEARPPSCHPGRASSSSPTRPAPSRRRRRPWRDPRSISPDPSAGPRTVSAASSAASCDRGSSPSSSAQVTPRVDASSHQVEQVDAPTAARGARREPSRAPCVRALATIASQRRRRLPATGDEVQPVRPDARVNGATCGIGVPTGGALVDTARRPPGGRPRAVPQCASNARRTPRTSARDPRRDHPPLASPGKRR